MSNQVLEIYIHPYTFHFTTRIFRDSIQTKILVLAPGLIGVGISYNVINPSNEQIMSQEKLFGLQWLNYSPGLPVSMTSFITD